MLAGVLLHLIVNAIAFGFATDHTIDPSDSSVVFQSHLGSERTVTLSLVALQHGATGSLQISELTQLKNQAEESPPRSFRAASYAQLSIDVEIRGGPGEWRIVDHAGDQLGTLNAAKAAIYPSELIGSNELILDKLTWG